MEFYMHTGYPVTSSRAQRRSESENEVTVRTHPAHDGNREE